MKDLLKDSTVWKDQCYIDGKWISSEQLISVHNPASGRTIASIPQLNDQHINEAIDAASLAFTSWSKYPAVKRSRLLMAWLRLVKVHEEDLAKIMVAEQGKPLREAIGEIRYAASYIEFYAEEAKRIYGDVMPNPFAQTKAFVIKQPIGPVAIITPWNFPAAMMIRKMAPALAAGCTCVIKPDERTPLSAMAVVGLLEKAKFPKGVVNLVTGTPSKIGTILTASKKIKKISFTGSTEVGKWLMKASADTVKRITLELGGNAPFIVFDDADIKAAAKGLVATKFRNAGQTCICANRIFVQKGKEEAFIKALKKEMALLRVGDGMEDADIGPLIDQKALSKITYLLEDAKDKGATLNSGGNSHSLGGTFFQPTIITGVQPQMEIFKTEIFGPVVSVTPFETEDEVIELANNTPYGLAGYLYSNDYKKIWRVAEALEYGMVGVNTGVISSAAMPFGGIKESGFGREGSKYGLDDYMNLKYITMGF